MGAGQSKAKDGIPGKDGKDGISVKDWGLWSESDKTEFITAIRNNEAFRDAVKNKLSSDVDFRSVIVNLMKEDSSFKSSFINSLAADVPFRNSVAEAVNNASFKTDITGQLVATLLKDQGFIKAAIGPKGDSIVGPKGDSIVGPKGDSIVGPIGPIGLTPQITEANIRTPVSELLKKEGLWCANGTCVLPANQDLRINNEDGRNTHFNWKGDNPGNYIRGNTVIDDNTRFNGKLLSLHPDTVLSADRPNIVGGRLNLTANDLTVGVNARFTSGIQVNNRNLMAELDKLRTDLNDIRNNAVRTDRNYRIQSRRIDQTNWMVRNEDGSKIMWANGGNGDKEAVRFIGAHFQA